MVRLPLTDFDPDTLPNLEYANATVAINPFTGDPFFLGGGSADGELSGEEGTSSGTGLFGGGEDVAGWGSDTVTGDATAAAGPVYVASSPDTPDGGDDGPAISGPDFSFDASSLAAAPLAGEAPGGGAPDAGGLIFVSSVSDAKGGIPGGNGGGNGGGGNGGGGDDGGGDGTVSEYLSGDPGGYNVEIDFKGSWTVDLQQDVIDAAELISDLILGDVGDVRYRGKVIDDIRITAEVTEIDGEGGILGQAGPTAIRTADYLPAVGVMEFDVADAEVFDGLGLWDEIIAHEMLHTIGFGTIWDLKGLLSGAGTDSPTFTGAAATEAYAFLYSEPDATAVPVEQDGGPGTRDSHWDEETFDTELMTGYLDPANNYLSDMTVASLEDLGYDTVWTGDYGAIA